MRWPQAIRLVILLLVWIALHNCGDCDVKVHDVILIYFSLLFPSKPRFLMLSFTFTLIKVFDRRMLGTPLDAEKGMDRSVPLAVLVEEVLQGVELLSAL